MSTGPADGGRRAARTRRVVAVVTAVSLAAFVLFFGADLEAAAALLVRRASVAGLLAYLLYSTAVLALVGLAWLAASGEPARRAGTFVWARLVREAAADLLPFSQLGAIVIGFQVVRQRGVPGPVVYASFIADLAVELASQALFTLFGIGVLWACVGAAHDDGPMGGTLWAVAAVTALAIAAGSARWTLPVAHRLVTVALPAAAHVVADTSAALHALYRRPARITAAFLVNAAAWVASAAGAWLGLRLVGIDVPLPRILALESLVFAVRSVAFAIPGGLGVQESAYALLGPLLGVSAEAAVAIAVLKRVRDVAIGLPTLLAWQATLLRRSPTAHPPLSPSEPWPLS